MLVSKESVESAQLRTMEEEWDSVVLAVVVRDTTCHRDPNRHTLSIINSSNNNNTSDDDKLICLT